MLKRLAPYTISALILTFAVGMTLYINLLPEGSGEARYVRGLGRIDYSLIGLAGAMFIVPLWGIIAVVLSELKDAALKGALSEVTVRRTSWHYRLSTKVYNREPYYDDARSECEYWARLLYGLTHLLPIYLLGYVFVVLVWLFVAIILAAAWLAGFPANFRLLSIKTKNQKFLVGKRHWLGPLLSVALLTSGTVLGLTLTESWDNILAFPHWQLVGWGLLGLFLAVPTLILIRIALRFMVNAVKPLSSFLLVRFIAKVCRPVKFV